MAAADEIMKPVNLSRLATEGEAAAAAACSAKQRGKHICRRNQREGWLTTRVCRSTKPAHKHGDYASARERRATGERNNAIKPSGASSRFLSNKKERTSLPRSLQELSAGRKDPLLGSLSLRSASGPPLSPEGGVLRKTSFLLLLITFKGRGAQELLGTADSS